MSKSKVLITLHKSSIDGPITYYANHLRSTGAEVYTIEHPLNDYDSLNSDYFENNKKIKSIKRHSKWGIVNLLIDCFLTLYFTIRLNIDIFIGANNFDTLMGLICRHLFRKRLKKVIYFATDFSEERFKNPVLDHIYYYIEGLVCKYSDLVISNTFRAETKRFGFGLDRNNSAVIPNGVSLKNEDFKNKKIDTRKFIYLGSVSKEHGLLDLIQKIHPFVKKLVIIGYGEYMDKVKEFCQDKEIEIEIFVKKDHLFCIDYMKKFNGIGLAPYNNHSKWTYYCSPQKVNEYIACGIPVLMSSVPEISEYISRNKLGIVYKDLNELVKLDNLLKELDIDTFYKKSAEFYNLYNSKNLHAKMDRLIGV
jgi:glycosyltransferase involved in cell wall biosynthesis